MEPSANFLLSDLKKAQPISGWEDFWSDGTAFLKTASSAYAQRKNAFTTVILYNIIAMAMEKFVMTSLMCEGKLPYNHTMKDLVEAMDEAFPGAISDLREGLLNLDQYQEICDIDMFKISGPAMEEIPAMLDLASRLRELVEKQLSARKRKRGPHVCFKGEDTFCETGRP
ncbi:MAG: hypothetical protein A2505_11295 [Deltaproteobacteria bacterium RIFOXYD12_FULL_55_16]|nr:MAG: hypothetical protein A2505_11295 [Deltaproteobacteria bacterium RIFOXYD12_FULL_55_16]